jgi:hypothetical protein
MDSLPLIALPGMQQEAQRVGESQNTLMLRIIHYKLALIP